jgi:hypothetical protein
MPFHLGDETAISYNDNYMILRVAYRIQLERGIRVNRIGTQTDPNAKLIGESEAYSEPRAKVNGNFLAECGLHGSTT